MTDFAVPPTTARRTRRTRRAGFTLIEVLIVVAIVGILAAIAYPSYGEHVQRTRRTPGQFALLSAVQSMERCRATRFTYSGCSPTPTLSEGGDYALSVSIPNASSYTLTATAQGRQANDTDCATLTIDSLGNRGPVASGASESVCWN